MSNLCRSLTVTFAALVTASALAQPAAPPPRVVSPELGAGGATFRLRAPEASEVRLVSGGDVPSLAPGSGLDLAKGADGVWSATIPALPGGAYRYVFVVDGVNTADPSNRHASESNGNVWSLVYVPGDKFMDSARGPHGAVAEVVYYSTVLGRDRRMHVYTPRGYERGSGRFPVFYLLHGAFDSDDSWSTVGRAGFILDNLIAAGDAVPMVVVMPDGHTGPFTIGPGGLALEEFEREFQTDIKPFVESHYRVKTDRADTAIAGLSMGGAQTLDIAMTDLSDYGYVGVFSSGVFDVAQNSSWEERFGEALDDSALKRGLDLVWFATGRDDFLLETSKATVALLEKHGFTAEFHESTGGHTWINWREYLATFAPKLFR
jgi:enterochelin esterase-like enzyme